MKKYYLINNNVFNRIQFLQYLNNIAKDKYFMVIAIAVIDASLHKGHKSICVEIGGFDTLIQFINVRIK
jgi:hypothetical protein